MRYSRVLLMPVLVLGAACAEPGTSADDPLGRDLLLATQVHTDAVERELSALGGAGICSAPMDQASPTAGQQAQAERVLQRAQEAALMGEQRRAHQLYREAAQLDGSSATIAYHLARSSDALDDRAAAVDAYCRFLTLAPGTQQAADVRGRLAALAGLAGGESQPDSQAVAPSPAAPTPATRAASASAVRRPAARVASARRSSRVSSSGARSTAGTQPAAGSTVRTETSAGSGENGPARDEAATQPPRETRETREAPSEVAASPAPASTARAGRDNTMRGAVIGAAAGAIVGAAMGRDVKSGVVGAAAGGLLGAVVGRTTSRGQALRGGTFRTPTWSPR